MPAINVVRFRVKPGREAEFVDAHRNLKDSIPGMRRGWLVKTGDRSFCIVGLWKDHDDLVKSRPAMIANLDKVRGLLEDLGGGLGVTDPVSGEIALEIAGKEKEKDKGKGGKAGGRGDDRSARAGRGGERGKERGGRGERSGGGAEAASADPARAAKRAERKRTKGKSAGRA
jgi:hypothetical protein